MLRTPSLVEWEIRSVFSCTAAFCGATHSAVEHREEGVEAFRQQRVRENRIRHVGGQRAPLGSRSTLCRAALRYICLRGGEFWRKALAVPAFGGCQANGLSLSRIALGSDENHASSSPGAAGRGRTRQH